MGRFIDFEHDTIGEAAKVIRGKRKVNISNKAQVIIGSEVAAIGVVTNRPRVAMLGGGIALRAIKHGLDKSTTRIQSNRRRVLLKSINMSDAEVKRLAKRIKYKRRRK